MKKKDDIERNPVPMSNLEIFMGTIYSLAKPLGIDQISEVYSCVEMLGKAVERHIAESGFSKGQDTAISKNVKKFITIFKNRYLHYTDREYDYIITGVESNLMKQTVKKLLEYGFDVDEYLIFMFDFIEKNPNFDPTITFMCSKFAIERFLNENKELIKERKANKLHLAEELDLTSRARALIRLYMQDQEMKDKVINVLLQYQKGSIMIQAFRMEIESFENEAKQETQTTQETQTKQTEKQE